MLRGATSDESGRLGVDPAEHGVYDLLNSLVLPRPIAWVSTRSSAGVDNLAPHSYYTVSSADPPVVQFTSSGHKDSLRNVLATGEFVVNVCPVGLVEEVNITAVPMPPDVSEVDAAGLTRLPSHVVTPCRIAESPAAIECRLLGTREFGDSTVVFGAVVWISVDEEVVTGGRVDVRRLDPLARLGGPGYSTIGEVVAVPRMTYAEWQARQARPT